MQVLSLRVTCIVVLAILPIVSAEVTAVTTSKKPATTKQPKPVSSKQSKPAPAKQSKPVKEKSTNPTPLQKANKGKVRKVQNVKSSLQLVDESDEEQAQPKPEPEPEPQGEQVDYDLQQGIQMSLESFQPPVNGVAFHEPTSELQTTKKTSTTDQYIFHRRILVIEEASTGPSAQPEDDTSANIVRDTLSPTDAETCAETDNTNSKGDTKILNIGEEQGDDVANKVSFIVLRFTLLLNWDGNDANRFDWDGNDAKDLNISEGNVPTPYVGDNGSGGNVTLHHVK
ncbi:hypothetical protein Tco_0205232 [Tanacetum coccineum]